jgi:NADH dehydrogenase FAD-containing subunit
MKTKKQKIVIVGGGFGGLKAAIDLARERIAEVTLVSDTDEFRYYPSLYHTATGGSRNVSSLPLAELLDPKQVHIKKAKVTGLDRVQKHVVTEDGDEIPYDYLILALGVVTNFFNIPGLEERAFGIKSLEDAEELKRHLHQQIIDERRPDINYVVVGGGPTGIELAGVLGAYVRYISRNHGIKQRAIHVDLVEASPRLLPRMPAVMSRRIAKQLRKKGVRLYLKSTVQGLTADELLVNGKPIRSHTVIWTAGMANNPFFAAQNFQLSRNGKVRVDQYLQAEPSIFVIGDNADTPYSGMAQTALHDGSYIAKSLTKIIRDKLAPDPYRAKKPIYVMPAGPDWAAVLWGRVKIYGLTGWLLRRAADLIGFRDYEPVFKATKQWLAEYEDEDLCAVCQPDTRLVNGRVG